ncbi:queuine tRNA-ribosyltransferase [Mycobacterium phage Quesadilla]|uniref:Queuine tRNA-ribosyltransferase n=1 Tax=Mycobacterium phage Quesadilla TaxID=2664226 RepID=A0A5Q2WCX4_9CAUD|nr:queuine tRNA-ribosyltransferase [Mycobacterium phage Quesadilla]QGH75250.1 queuine tRNA-ribosyltransferase [Mycobacterium phage Quesadilla]
MSLTIPAPRNTLCSYHFFKDFDLDRLQHLRVIGDSGAFSAKNAGATITTAELARWAKQWSHRLAWVAALDVIGDAEQTRRNWHEMTEVHGVPGVPTIHFGCDPALMDYYAERGVDFIGLGGLVGRPISAQMRWLVKAFIHARKLWPEMRFHGWGVTNPQALQLPFFSVDSSGWTSGVRYGRVTLRDPASGKVYPVILDGRATYEPEVARLLAKHYGVAPSEVAKSGPHNRLLMVRLSALSASVLEQHFRRMHRLAPITAPSWGQLAPPPSADPAPHMHLSMTGRSGEEYDVAALTGPHLHLATMQINNAHPEQLDALVASGGTSADPTTRGAST